jgi:streptogrisin B
LSAVGFNAQSGSAYYAILSGRCVDAAGGGSSADINGAASPAVGQSVCRAGRVGGIHCGTITSLNNTISYPEGTVYGLFRSSACSAPGDIGGPAFSGGKALGLIVGASGSCASGGSTYYQPVAEALARYGLTLH